MPSNESTESGQPDRRHSLTEAQAKWGDIPHERRVQWCQMQLDFPPIWLGTFPMIATSRAVQRREYTNITAWIKVAHDFEAAGFTPESYYLLRMCIRSSLRGRGEHRLVYVSVGNGDIKREYIKAGDWVLWPELVNSGMTPLRAAGLILDGGMKKFPDGFLINGQGQIVLSTDD
jgi:hypothetical protein